MLRSTVRQTLTALLAAALFGCATAPSPVDVAPLQPEAASGRVSKQGLATKRFAIATANPLATQAGYDILKQGGSAIDAAVAVQMVLALVEPQSSGIGGGAFVVHFDGKRTEAFDGRETAPAAATEDLFLDTAGRPLPFRQAIVGGRAVGVPGAVAMLEQAHREHGKLPWARLFEPAIALAEAGFAISPRLNSLLVADKALQTDPVAATYFFDAQGQARPVGYVLRNPELAAVLRGIARRGSGALMRGDVAQAIVDKVQRHASNPGKLSLADLAGYRPVKRAPLCFDYEAVAHAYHLCGMPPPSSGAIAIGQILGMLARTPAAGLPLENGVPSAEWLHVYVEASRLAFADRAQYVADPDFVVAPGGNWNQLLDAAYLDQRARLIGPKRMESVSAGRPAGASVSYAPMPVQEEFGTSHISVVDANGNALAMTTTVESAFGSRQMVNRGRGLAGGFLLNNQLSDFSFEPRNAAGLPVANRVQPGKRPRSAMAPTLVFDKPTGRLLMSVGSSGGAFIIHTTAKTLYGVLNWGLNVQQAFDLPNFAALDDSPFSIETDAFPVRTLESLRQRGHRLQELQIPSGLQGITRTPDGYFSGADPRREGAVAGD